MHLRKCQMYQYTAVLPAFHLPGAKIAYETAGKGQGRLGEHVNSLLLLTHCQRKFSSETSDIRTTSQ